MPFLENLARIGIPSGLVLQKTMDPPRVIKTHLQFHLIPRSFWQNKCKVIYVARNAKDNLVSYFHFNHMNLTHPEPGPWEGYIQKFMCGQVPWGSWYDHVKGYWQEREKKNILFLFYEDMKENPRREIERIMRYLDLSLSDDVISRTFSRNYTFIPQPVFDHSRSTFMRKGVVGDWKNHFTPE
ncbi:sulfotransferase 1B1-like [Dunckerocampus dactyliophorus]|uniref:sulfotransferase 1B1-like n=1 Tax=Dunckerocampus dactyliophorus TaxID=161453 RepID=UPI002405297F|nr:sulfotransferase 1B1-like [Dunckerocampus dactyliophorus]